MCLLSVVRYISVFLSCVVFLLKKHLFVGAFLSFLLIRCLHFQVANNNHVVRIIIIPIVLFEFAICTVTCLSFLIDCILGLPFCLDCILLHMKYLFVVCCSFIFRISVLCCVFVGKRSFVFFPFCRYDVRISSLQAIAASFESSFLLYYCLNLQCAQLLVRSVWLFAFGVLTFWFCSYVTTYKVFVCCLFFVFVCCLYSRMLCFVEEGLFVVVCHFCYYDACFQFANNNHFVRIILLSVIWFEFPPAQLLVRSFSFFIVCVSGFVFAFVSSYI